MIGMVFGSVGTPLAPWQAAQVCALASISSAALAGAATAAKIPMAPHRVKIRRLLTADTSLGLKIFIVGSSILRRRSEAQGASLVRMSAPHHRVRRYCTSAAPNAANN